MREIKFKYLTDKRNGNFRSKAFTLDQIENGKASVWAERNFVNPAYLHKLQFTGLRDKNGKEIYEGDIVVTKYGDNGPAEVKWGIVEISHELPRKLCYYVDNVPNVECTALGEDIEGKTDWVEVIGNIYENPELLK